MNVTELWGEEKRPDDDPDPDPLTKRPSRFSSFMHMHLYGERNVPLVEDYVRARDKWAQKQQQQLPAAITQREFNVEYFLPKHAKSSDMRQLKSDYSLFCSIVSQAMLDVSFEESNAARTMYNIMTKRATKELSFGDVHSYFGKIADGKLDQLWDLATKMRMMKNLYDDVSGTSSSSSSGSKNEGACNSGDIKKGGHHRHKSEKEQKMNEGGLMITQKLLDEVAAIMDKFTPVSMVDVPIWANNSFKRHTGLGAVPLTKEEVEEVDAKGVEEEMKRGQRSSGSNSNSNSNSSNSNGSNMTSMKHRLSPKEAASELLVDICYRYVLLSGSTDDTSNGDTNDGVSTLLSFEELANEISSIVNEQTFDSLEARLFDLLGGNGVEYIIEVMEAADELKLTDSFSINQAIRVMMNDGTKSKKQLKKDGSRDKRKKDTSDEAVYCNGDSEVIDHLKMLDFGDEYIEQERSLGLQKMGYDNESWRENLAPEGSREYYQEKGLPVGSTRKVTKGFEEVFLPAPPKLPQPGREEFVMISSLPKWAQDSFEGTKKLNRIQSKVFESAYNSHENLLICAPTGAGKTNIAMLTFLALVKQHMYGDICDKENVKAIYIAPMKALCQEVVTKFSKRLEPLKMNVKEFTGDMTLSRQEIMDSQLIVTTPEKWDVVTRKGGDGSLATMVSLIIIDEVHLLADDRGAVIETIVARSHRHVEQSQTMVRIVGLSATLPNYADVADFLRVNKKKGLHFFGPEYRPVPLDQTFIGVTEKQRVKQKDKMNEKAYEMLITALEKGKQVMIFVHSRKETSKTMEAIRDLAGKGGASHMFENVQHEQYSVFKRAVDKSRSSEVQQLFAQGLGVHHAGMLRNDRSLVEQMFECGVIKVLCCTATLAWGVNLPAHTVIIKGTEIYDPERGGFVDLGILDVLQIFGRAGRPQYDNCGHAILITPHEKLNNYIRMLGHQAPIESSLIKALADHLNAEIVSGTINNINEAISWLSYTFLYIRMCKNPLAYGMKLDEVYTDPQLHTKRFNLVRDAVGTLDQCTMIRYDPRSENLASTDMGRIASHFYLRHGTIDAFNVMLSSHLSDSEALHVMCSSAEFDQLKMRPEELSEMDKMKKYAHVKCKAPVEDTAGKVNILLQGFLDNCRVNSFTLQSDMNYIAQNAGRIARALFEICLKRGWSTMSSHFLGLAKAIDQRMRPNQTPLRQFRTEIPSDIALKIEDADANVDRLYDMEANEIGELIKNKKYGAKIFDLLRRLPYLEVNAFVQPITRGVLRINLDVISSFKWTDKYHGGMVSFWLWIEDGENEYIYHSERLTIQKKYAKESQSLEITIPVREPLPPQYYIRVVSDTWVGCESVTTLSFQHLMLPTMYAAHTDLLDVHPIPKTALNNKRFEKLYKYPYFNPIQSQTFYQLYHTNNSVLVGAPTGSGKTVTSELAILRLLSARPGKKIVYIAPLKALARERLADWQQKFGKSLGLIVVELSGDITPDLALLQKADIIISTPEKWDGITRGWQKREYVRHVELVIIDEIHLLGVDRGPVLEVIVSRMRYISEQTTNPIRFIGLSTALANAKDLSDWLGIEKIGTFNFRPSVRPIPMTIYINGFSGKHYCPRMATMNKPIFACIMEHSPKKPVLVFVSSRRQTRLTALDLISFCASDDNPKKFLHMEEDEAEVIASTMRDNALRDTLVFGIGIHHAGLDSNDRLQVETLFCEGKIQVLVCTSTLAWGVNFPAHLVVVKGTEYYDGKAKRYVDFPVTDILQMIGRAGRPQFDDTGVACLLVHEPKKNFYKKFLHEPFPVESSLHNQLHNHINAEITTGMIYSLVDCIQYLSWTYYFRRLLINPSYYGLEDTSSKGIENHLIKVVTDVLKDLQAAGCIEFNEDYSEIAVTTSGQIASYYYLDYQTVGMFQDFVKNIGTPIDEISKVKLDADAHPESDYEGFVDLPIEELVRLLSDAMEFSELPVRHNEEELNAELSFSLPWPADVEEMESPHTKTFLLLQAHFYRQALPISDYVNDTKSVLDQVPRVLNALIDVMADAGQLNNVLKLMQVSPMIIQGMPDHANELLQLPGMDIATARKFGEVYGIKKLRDLIKLKSDKLVEVCRDMIPDGDISHMLRVINDIPLFNIEISVKSMKDSSATENNEASSNELLNHKSSIPYSVTANSKINVAVSLQRSHGNTGKINVYSPRYHKQKNPSWWLVLGDESKKELLSMKRIGEVSGKSLSSELEFTSEDIPLGNRKVTIHLVCDSMFGINASSFFLYETASSRKLLRNRLKEEADIKFREEAERRTMGKQRKITNP